MSGLWHLLHTTVPPYQELLNAAKASKGLYMGLAAMVGLVMNVFVAPHEDDLPISLQVVVVVLLAAEGFVLPVWFPNQASLIAGLAVVAVVATILYVGAYWIWGINKIVERPHRLFRRPGNQQVRVLRGLWRRPEARDNMTANHRSLQEYFADCGYRQNDVWSVWALAPVRLLALLSYVTAVAAYTGVLLLIAKA
jgi:hypothetical protein